jgi:GAF domain-containing protein
MTINKQQRYEEMLPQLASLIAGETEEMSVLANVAAVIHETFGFWWTGFYLVRGGELRLGPFQGPVACMHIAFGRGVCGTAWEQQQTIVVPDVEQFPGHIACSSESRSEIVVPLFDAHHKVIGVLDIDSRELNTFDETDRQNLEQVANIIAQAITSA